MHVLQCLQDVDDHVTGTLSSHNYNYDKAPLTFATETGHLSVQA